MGSTIVQGARARLVITFVLVAALGALACDDQGAFYDGPFRPLESQVVFSFFEAHDPWNDPQAPLVLSLLLATETIYPCCNWHLATQHELGPASGRVELQGILVPSTCLTALGPAGAQLPWSLRNGTVPLRFVHGVVTDTYTLQVTDSTIAIVPAAGTLTRPRELLFRRPAR